MQVASTSFCSPSTLLTKRVPVSVKAPVPRLRCHIGWRAYEKLVLRIVFEWLSVAELQNGPGAFLLNFNAEVA